MSSAPTEGVKEAEKYAGESGGTFAAQDWFYSRMKLADIGFSSPGDSAGGYATKERNSHSTANPNQMENDLELKKDSKVSTNEPGDVAGRHGKGLGFIEKLVPGK